MPGSHWSIVNKSLFRSLSGQLANLKYPFQDQATYEKQQPQQIAENDQRSRITLHEAFPNLTNPRIDLILREHEVDDHQRSRSLPGWRKIPISRFGHYGLDCNIYMHVQL